MAVYDNKKILIDYNELPRINGVRIESIYLTAFDTRQIKGGWVREEHASYYYACHPYFSSDKIQHVRTLPKELQEVFDNPQRAVYLNEETGEEREVLIKKVTSIWYRTRCSGNGSFIDSSIHLRGAVSDNNSGFLDVRRNCKSIVSKETTGALERLIKTLNVRADIPLMSEEEYTYYPSTHLRVVDGMYYPDPVSSGWRRSSKMPYTSPDGNKNNAIRVLDETLRCHVFLIKVPTEELEVGCEYVAVDFHYDEPNYCHISRWAHFKEDTPNEYLKFRIDKVGSKYIHTTVMEQVPRYAKKEFRYNPFYKIVRIRNTEDLD